MIAVTQARGVGDLGKNYVDKQISRGKTKREAIRLLRRHISDAAFTALRADAHLLDASRSITTPADAQSPLAAAA